MELTHRTCSICKIEKEITDFTRDKSEKTGYTYGCKACRRERETIWRNANKDKVRQKNAERVEQRKAFYQSEKGIESSRRAHLKRKYGITLEEYNKLSEAQNHVCDICGEKEQSERFNVLCVDHDHKTGKIRSLLCGKCNKGLGCFNDDTALLQKSINYLTKYKNESNINDGRV